MTKHETGRALIRLEGVGKSFLTDELETRALEGVHLEIARGEYVAIEGPSGASLSCVSQSPIQKSSCRYSAAVQWGEVTAAVEGDAVAAAVNAMPSAANAIRRDLDRSDSFMDFPLK